MLIITDKANLQDVKNSIKDHEFVGYNIKQIISLDKVDDENVVVMRYHEQIVDWAVRQWIDVYSTNHIDVAMSKRTCFAHYIGH